MDTTIPYYSFSIKKVESIDSFSFDLKLVISPLVYVIYPFGIPVYLFLS